jgi:F-type H+-transporting ATPase subunit delta
MKVNQEVRSSAKRLLKLALSNGEINEERILAIVNEVLTHKPRHYISILERFMVLLKFEIAKRTLTITSAKPIDKSENEQLLSSLIKIFPGAKYIQSEVNPDLIGGLKLKFGSNVWDDTLLARLQKVQRELSA